MKKKKNKKIKETIIYNDVYSVNFIIIQSNDHDAASEKYDVDWEESANGTTTMLEDGDVYIFLEKDAELDLAVHEIDHAIDFLWSDRGIEKLEGPDEAHAYMVQWLFREIYHKCYLK